MLHQGLCHFKYKATAWIIEAKSLDTWVTLSIIVKVVGPRG